MRFLYVLISVSIKFFWTYSPFLSNSISLQKFNFSFFNLKKCLFTYFEKERETNRQTDCMSSSWRGANREGQRKFQAGSVLSQHRIRHGAPSHKR